MNVLATIRALVSESRRAYVFDERRSVQIFFTLISLYIKSKLSNDKEHIVSHRIEGFTIYAYDYPTLIELYREIFIRGIYQFKSNSQSPFIIDAGSNIGVSVLFFKKLYPQAEIWAFEPNPDSYFLLEKNMLDNIIENVKIFPIALSNADGPIDFYIPSQKGSLNASSINNGVHQSFKVDSKQLSSLLPDKKKIDCIKIDIEGDEEKVMEDLLSSGLLSRIDNLIIEYHLNINANEKLQHLISMMKDHQFEYRRIDEKELITSDVIIHFYRG